MNDEHTLVTKNWFVSGIALLDGSVVVFNPPNSSTPREAPRHARTAGKAVYFKIEKHAHNDHTCTYYNFIC